MIPKWDRGHFSHLPWGNGSAFTVTPQWRWPRYYWRVVKTLVPLSLLWHHPRREERGRLLFLDGSGNPGSPRGLHWYCVQESCYRPVGMEVPAPYWAFSDITLSGISALCYIASWGWKSRLHIRPFLVSLWVGPQLVFFLWCLIRVVIV